MQFREWNNVLGAINEARICTGKPDNSGFQQIEG